MKLTWEDLPKPLNCFTVREAVMFDFDTKKIVRCYSANTKILVVQKSVTPTATFYRTSESARYDRNYVFKASAFGLPDEKAPSEPLASSDSHTESSFIMDSTLKKTHTTQERHSSNDGETSAKRSWLKRLFRRKNG